jgi:hypothetical protein
VIARVLGIDVTSVTIRRHGERLGCTDSSVMSRSRTGLDVEEILTDFFIDPTVRFFDFEDGVGFANLSPDEEEAAVAMLKQLEGETTGGSIVVLARANGPRPRHFGDRRHDEPPADLEFSLPVNRPDIHGSLVSTVLIRSCSIIAAGTSVGGEAGAVYAAAGLRGRRDQISAVLDYVLKANAQQKIGALIFIGDAFEESLDVISAAKADPAGDSGIVRARSF